MKKDRNELIIIQEERNGTERKGQSNNKHAKQKQELNEKSIQWRWMDEVKEVWSV